MGTEERRPDGSSRTAEQPAALRRVPLGAWLGVLGILALVSLVVELGFFLPAWLCNCLCGFQFIVAAVFVVETVWALLRLPAVQRIGARRRADVLVVASLMAYWPVSVWAFSKGAVPSAVTCVRLGVLYFSVSRGIGLQPYLTRTRLVSALLSRMYTHPPLAVPAGFVLVILIGTLLLCLPRATMDGVSMHPIDAVFTATSATCVTGLIVKSTPGFFSQFGQWIILVLIQVGGLGIMTMSAVFLMMIGKRLWLPQQVVVKSALSVESLAEVGRTVKMIVIFTFAVEAIGVVSLFAKWSDEMPEVETALFYSIFHSVSAFCNAGFALFDDSLMGYCGNPVVNLTVMALIVLGGLGFAVLMNIAEIIKSRALPQETVADLSEGGMRPGQDTAIRPRVTLHTKLVLATSVFLIILGMVLFMIFEAEGVLSELPLGQRVMASFFQSVTARTAGFNTVNTKEISPASSLTLLALMFVGGSPGSTAGGIKTTTFAVLVLSVFAFLGGKSDVTWGGRSVSEDNQRRAIAVAAIGIVVLFVFLLLLFALPTLKDGSPGGQFKEMVFEAFSAFGTVGLSQGITPRLSRIGEVLITLLMLIGRVGPLTIAVAIRGRRAPARIKYPEAKVMIG